MKKNWPILVVDDEDVMCESMAAWLREDGYRVDTAPNGQQAIELAKATDYAICFVDLKMPGGMDGIETMMEIPGFRNALLKGMSRRIREADDRLAAYEDRSCPAPDRPEEDSAPA